MPYYPPPSAGGSVAIGSAVGSGTSGSIPYIDSGILLAQDNANLFWNATAHALVIGPTLSLGTKLNIKDTDNYASIGTTSYSRANVSTDPTIKTIAGMTADVTASLTSNPAAHLVYTGFNGVVTVGGTDTGVYTGQIYSPDVRGGSVVATYSGTGSMPHVVGLLAFAQRNGVGAGSVTNLDALYCVALPQTAAGTVTRASGLFVAQPISIAGGTTTNTYGVYIDSQTFFAGNGTQTNTPYGIYQAGLAQQNYFGGDVRVAGGLSQLQSPTDNVTVLANHSMHINRKYTIASGKKVTLGSGAIFRIL